MRRTRRWSKNINKFLVTRVKMSSTSAPYYQIDELKENLDEEDLTPNEDRLQNWGMWIDNKINDKLRYIFPATDFTPNLIEQNFLDNGLTSTDYKSLLTLATAGVEAKFWKETNGDVQGLDKWFEELDRWIQDLIQIPATTETG